MQDTSSHNHLAPWCKGFFSFPCPPHCFPALCLSLSLSVSVSLSLSPVSADAFEDTLYRLSWDPSCTLELPENTLIPFLFHTLKIKHSRRTLLPGETDWLHLWQAFYLHWLERQRKIRCSPADSLSIQWKEAPNLNQPRIPTFWACPTIYKSVELAPLITAGTSGLPKEKLSYHLLPREHLGNFFLQGQAGGYRHKSVPLVNKRCKFRVIYQRSSLTTLKYKPWPVTVKLCFLDIWV